MRIPENTRRPIIYVTTAVLVFGGIVYEYRHGLVPQPALAPTVALANRSDQAARAEKVEKVDKASAPAAKGAAAENNQAAATTQQPRPKLETYKVVAGDTVGGIAEKFGLKSQTLLWANDLDETDTIQIGEELKIPAADGLVYTVQSGDTLWDIVADRSANIDDVIRANPDVESGTLQVGQTLLIPGGQPVVRRQVASRGASRPSSHSLDYWPTVGPITDPFGWRIHPVYGTKSFHDGMDIGVDSGTPLKAAMAGKVIYADWFGGYGITVKIDHGGGIVTQYSHMSKSSVTVGQSVAAGGHIGYSGNTGVSTGPHLHFMVIVNGSPTDPMPWMP
jgi:LysM repeat protein